MWCVADLDDEYIEKMEDVLETYERPYNPERPVVCLATFRRKNEPLTRFAPVPSARGFWKNVQKASPRDDRRQPGSALSLQTFFVGDVIFLLTLRSDSRILILSYA